MAAEDAQQKVSVSPALLADLERQAHAASIVLDEYHRTVLKRRRQGPTGEGTRAYIREHTLQVATLVGLLFYGGGLFVYLRFYGTFGVDPHEVGLGYTAALTHLVPAFLLWLFAWLYVLPVLFAAHVIFVVARAWWRIRRDPAPGHDLWKGVRSWGTAFRWLWRKFQTTPVELSVVLIAVLFLLFIVSALAQPDSLAERVRRGEEVRPILDTGRLGFVPDAIWTNSFRIRVEDVRVWPTAPRSRLPAHLTAGTTLAYLGRNADTIVLYDSAGSGRTLRIPAGQVVLSDPDR
jgi:hypothetical protein